MIFNLGGGGGGSGSPHDMKIHFEPGTFGSGIAYAAKLKKAGKYLASIQDINGNPLSSYGEARVGASQSWASCSSISERSDGCYEITATGNPYYFHIKNTSNGSVTLYIFIVGIWTGSSDEPEFVTSN